MNSSIFAVRPWRIACAVIAIAALVLAPFTLIKAQSAPTTGVLTVNKEIVGTTTVSADAFSFLINGASSTPFEADGSNEVTLATGTYSVTEVPASGYTVSYQNCDGIDLTAAGATCTITNTLATSSAGAALGTGVLQIRKVFAGTTTASADDYTFDVVRNYITPILTNETWNANGVNRYAETTGVYTVTEDAAPGFTTSYHNSINSDANCTALMVTPNATTTCTITNTATSSNNGGNGTSTHGTLLVKKLLFGGTASADDFAFKVGGGATTTFEADGSNRFTLATGTYSVTETPNVLNYAPSYSNCTNVTVNPNATTTCTITNTYQGTTSTSTGTLLVNKIVSGGTDATSSFSFQVNGGTVTAWDADGSNRMTVPAGTYSIVETPVANYTPAYSNCTNVAVAANATTTCTVTNTFNEGGAHLYEIHGYVWNDEDDDGVFDDDEDPLSGWNVHASAQGEITRNDTTDATGYYTLLVTTGTWNVSEDVQNGWEQTYPESSTYSVNVPNENTEQVTLGFPLNLFFKVANAQTATTTGLYNFGNKQSRSSSGGGGGGGNGIRVELTDNNNNDNDNGGTSGTAGGVGGGSGLPGGQVLGAATSAYPSSPYLPYGAPNTGAGGGELYRMNQYASLPLLGAVVVLLFGFGVARAMRDPRDRDEVF